MGRTAYLPALQAINMDDVVSLTRELIEISSHEDETEAGDFIEAWLRERTDATVMRDDAGNVIASRGSSGEPALALVGHHDVVPPADEQVDEHGATISQETENRIYGRGSADMKGAVAAMMLAFRDADPSLDLAFASFVGEEVGGIGARHAVADGFVPTFAVVGEGSAQYATDGALDVVVAHRGRRGSTITARGRACHASEPEAGINAIYRATEAIDRLRDIERPTATVAGETLHGSLEATKINAGTADNVIPETCQFTLDERTLPGSTIDIESAIEDLDGIEWEIDQDWPPMQCHDERFAERVRLALAAVGPDPRLITKPHATDASWLAEAGTATVVVGPAERGQAHTSEESVDIELLQLAKRGYQAIADSIEG